MRKVPEFFLLCVILSVYYLVCWSLLGKSIRYSCNYVTWTRGVHRSWLNSTSSWSQIIFRCCRSMEIAEVNSSLVSSPLHLFFLSTVNFSFTVFPPIAFELKTFEALPWPVQPKTKTWFPRRFGKSSLRTRGWISMCRPWIPMILFSLHSGHTISLSQISMCMSVHSHK